ncbi:T9SS type A sorting domain-containing protein [Dyadobacter sp. BHUBP1]|uniref:T9SS type A sorting domain-containing protein n=1 Tax=Dyadobacter sp. BHUBP1 TaxID=3424178 RepID=UPI003D33D00E
MKKLLSVLIIVIGYFDTNAQLITSQRVNNPTFSSNASGWIRGQGVGASNPGVLFIINNLETSITQDLTCVNPAGISPKIKACIGTYDAIPIGPESISGWAKLEIKYDGVRYAVITNQAGTFNQYANIVYENGATGNIPAGNHFVKNPDGAGNIQMCLNNLVLTLPNTVDNNGTLGFYYSSQQDNPPYNGYTQADDDIWIGEVTVESSYQTIPAPVINQQINYCSAVPLAQTLTATLPAPYSPLPTGAYVQWEEETVGIVGTGTSISHTASSDDRRYRARIVLRDGCFTGPWSNYDARVTRYDIPAAPVVNTSAASCTGNGTATITNWNSALSYTFSPAGPSVSAGGVISGMSPGTNYNVMAAGEGGCTSNAQFNIAPQLTCAVISGTVFNDADGMIGGANGVPMGDGATINTPVTVTLYAPDGTTILATATTDASGNYFFDQVNVGHYVVRITPPTAYVNVSSTEPTSPADGDTDINISGTTNVTGVNFGLNQPPNSNNVTYQLPSQPTSDAFIPLNGGSNPPLTNGSDPEDGIYTGNVVTTPGPHSNNSPAGVVVTSLPINGELWYNGTQVTASDITNGTVFADPALLSVKLTGSGYTSTSFEYAYVDAAGSTDLTSATYTLTWDNALPVKLVYFNATALSGTALLSWATASEETNKGFAIERSADGRNWAQIGFIDSNSPEGESNTKSVYSFTDEAPIADKNYYRLKQMDFNGQHEYSLIRVVHFGVMNDFNIYPNPVKSEVSIDGLAGAGTIRLYDTTGRVIANKAVSETSNVISLEGLSEGLYYLHIIYNGKATVKSLVIGK